MMEIFSADEAYEENPLMKTYHFRWRIVIQTY